MNIDKYEISICYHADGNGCWTKITGDQQCTCENIIYGDCQGVVGHDGCHWNYQSDGSYAYWRNKDDESAIGENIACGSIPPDSESYVNPSLKINESYHKFYKVEKVLDKNIIEMLDQGITPEENASIDSPCSKEEIEYLKQKGVVDMFGTIDFSENYDYKKHRNNKNI